MPRAKTYRYVGNRRTAGTKAASPQDNGSGTVLAAAGIGTAALLLWMFADARRRMREQGYDFWTGDRSQ